jgi:hypothetical protein
MSHRAYHWAAIAACAATWTLALASLAGIHL